MQQTLIADSGSTKTDWRLINADGKIQQFRTAGLHPLLLTASQVGEIVSKELATMESDNVSEVFFYGAGCSGDQAKSVIQTGLKGIFTNAIIEIKDDLTAACRALSDNKECLVAILGTGSNSCHYDGKKIIDQVPTLGYVMGDEGGGVDIGKQLLRSFFYREMPQPIADAFDAQYKLNRNDVVDAVFKQSAPNRYLASFTEFAFKHRKEVFIMDIVAKCLDGFFNHHLLKYKVGSGVSLHATGSVAYYFGDLFRTIAIEKKIRVGTITESPIAALTLYHLAGK